MYTLYRRHTQACGIKDRFYKRCKCPMWVEGTSDQGTYVRKSLRTCSWERALEILQAWELPPATVTVPQVCKVYLDDAAQRNLSEASLRKYRYDLKQLQSFAQQEGIARISNFNLDILRRFRSTWKDGPRSAAKKIERLRTLFRFCHDNGWVQKNWARLIRPPKLRDNPTLPFTKAEVERILAACPNEFVKTFILVLRYTGMRIGDTSLLTTDQVESGKVFLYTQKTGTPVRIPIPDFLVSRLNRTSLKGNHYFLLGQSTKKVTLPKLWGYKLKKVFKAAGIQNGHPHRFRDTFAVELLLAGVPLEQVSVLLGHSSVKVTEKHYAPWVRERQEVLEQNVRRSWCLQPRLVVMRPLDRLGPSIR